MNTATRPCEPALYRRPLLFYASPHENGSTRRLLSQVLPRLPLAAEPEVIPVFEIHIRPCTDCRICYREECPLNGDGMGELLEKARQADLIITALPVYFNGTPSPMKAILDRSQQLFVQRFVQGARVFSEPKAGILLTTAGSDDGRGNEGEGAFDGAYAIRSGSATQGVRESIRMFYGCLGAVLAGHIAITGTDVDPSFTADPEEIGAVAQRLAAYYKDRIAPSRQDGQ